LPTDLDVVATLERGEAWAPSPGTGIGLTLVQHLVELHGGHVSAQDGQNGGAVFHVTLPHQTPDRATPRRKPN
jgi:two-component system, OmpR family, sensor histidine kinase KdpD